MPHSIVRHPQAERDLEECIVYIGEDNPEAAQAFYLAFRDSISQLAKFPLIGSLREFSNPKFAGIRMWRVKGFENYLIFYRVESNAIEVIRILYCSRDIQELFT